MANAAGAPCASDVQEVAGVRAELARWRSPHRKRRRGLAPDVMRRRGERRGATLDLGGIPIAVGAVAVDQTVSCADGASVTATAPPCRCAERGRDDDRGDRRRVARSQPRRGACAHATSSTVTSVARLCSTWAMRRSCLARPRRPRTPAATWTTAMAKTMAMTTVEPPASAGGNGPAAVVAPRGARRAQHLPQGRHLSRRGEPVRHRRR